MSPRRSMAEMAIEREARAAVDTLMRRLNIKPILAVR